MIGLRRLLAGRQVQDVRSRPAIASATLSRLSIDPVNTSSRSRAGSLAVVTQGAHDCVGAPGSASSAR
jgi:hypothetical protein